MRYRVYVAGAISANSCGKVLNNLRKGIQLSSKVFLAGYAPFSPFVDFHFQLVMNDEEVKNITTEDYYAYSIAWLEKADAMILTEGWEKSVGTAKELELAKQLNIPIYYSLDEMLEKLPPRK